MSASRTSTPPLARLRQLRSQECLVLGSARDEEASRLLDGKRHARPLLEMCHPLDAAPGEQRASLVRLHRLEQAGGAAGGL